MNELGFLRVTAASTITEVANPAANRKAIEDTIRYFSDSDVLVFGELCLSGYTCGELFTHKRLLDDCAEELVRLSQAIRTKQLVVVGLPMPLDGRLFNVAAVLCEGKILGLVPKQHLPTYQEFYEGRWFQSGAMTTRSEFALSLASSEQGVDSFFRSSMNVPFGTDLLFQCGLATVGVEICEDLWVPVPPSSLQTLAGANVLLNLSASNETVGKAPYRSSLVAGQSGRCNAAYAYASAGPSESTTDLVFGAHCVIAENGIVLGESQRVGSGLSLQGKKQEHADPLLAGLHSFTTVDVDLGRIDHDRRVAGTMHQQVSSELHKKFRRIPFELELRSSELSEHGLARPIDAHPFVPKHPATLQARCNEIFEIQCAALEKRVSKLPQNLPLVIGVSGGLDSTLALVVAIKMLDAIGADRKRLIGITMPGFGTSDKTRDNATELSNSLGIILETIDIRERCFGFFRDLKHSPFGISLDGKQWPELQHELESLPNDKRNDLTFENVQARVRTLLLMSRGFVIGTGDLSEGALGWSTYNADHMSMYNVNCSVPKTLVKFLVTRVATERFDGRIREILLDICNTHFA